MFHVMILSCNLLLSVVKVVRLLLVGFKGAFQHSDLTENEVTLSVVLQHEVIYLVILLRHLLVDTLHFVVKFNLCHCLIVLIGWKDYCLLLNSISLNSRLVDGELALVGVVELHPLRRRASVTGILRQQPPTAHQVPVLHALVCELVPWHRHLVRRTLTAQRTLLARPRSVDW